MSEDNKSLKDTIAQIDEENKSLRHFISNENVQRNKKTKNPNKYKNDIDGIKQEINQFSSEFNLQGKIVDKCLESLENNLDCGFEIKSLVSNYIENSKITDFQIKRLHSNVNNFCNRQYSYQGSVLLKKASDLPSPKDGNTKNMPSLFDELNLVSNKHNITILDNELSENIMERLSTIEKDLEEIKEISDKSNKSPKKSSTNYPKTFKNLALSHSIPFLKI